MNIVCYVITSILLNKTEQFNDFFGGKHTMNKKISYTFLIFSLILTMPIITANANLGPQELVNNEITANCEDNKQQIIALDGSYIFNGTTIDINTINETWIEVNLNGTLLVQIYQGDDHLKVIFQRIVIPTNELIMSLEMYSFEYDNTTLSIDLPSGIEISASYNYLGIWTFRIADFTISWAKEAHILDVFNTDFHVHIEDYGTYERIFVNYFGYLINVYRWADRSWIVNFGEIYKVNATYIPPVESGTLNVTYQKEAGPVIPVFTDFPDYNMEDPEVWHDMDGFLTIAFIETVLIIAHDNFVISIYEDKVVLDYVFVSIIIYMTTIIERIVIMFYEYTIIYYFTIVELFLVIIWETIELKVYQYQIIIVYEIFEIIILIFENHYEVTVVFHLELWIIEIVFVILLFGPVIIQPVIIRILPFIIPILVPMYFWIPVFINQYTYIYLPYLAEEIFIDIYNELLESPTHTIDFYVYDHLANPIVDANVFVNYNGSDYSTTSLAGGIYRVELPASDQAEVITVTATKTFYPTATLVYTLEVNWSTAIVTTVEASLPLFTIIVSLISIVIGTMVYNRKKMI